MTNLNQILNTHLLKYFEQKFLKSRFKTPIWKHFLKPRNFNCVIDLRLKLQLVLL